MPPAADARAIGRGAVNNTLDGRAAKLGVKVTEARDVAERRELFT